MATSSIVSFWLCRNHSKVNRLARFTKLYRSTTSHASAVNRANFSTSAPGHSPVAWTRRSGPHVHPRIYTLLKPELHFQRHNSESELSPFKNNESTSSGCLWHQVVNQFSSSGGGKSGIGEADLKREIDSLTDQFMETRDLLEDAMESKGSVYFNDDLVEAKEAVQETLKQYRDLLERLDEEQERNVRRTIGLKMEELRAQENMILESLKDD